MSKASRKMDAGPRDRTETLQRWSGVLVTALVHLLLLLLVMLSPPITMTAPQGSAGGSSSLQVTYVDLAPHPPSPRPAPRKAKPKAPAKALPKATRLQSTAVAKADAPVPPDVADASETPAAPPEPAQPMPAPADAPDETPQPPAHVWGQPPGMRPQDDPDSANAGLARRLAADNGRSNDPSPPGPDMEVGGYQAYYDLVSETRLLAWRDQGMTEVFLPLPGTRRLMVCPLEIALRRGSGKCRLVEPDSPELKTIGDARQVINMQRVYKLGEVLWRGPGPYR